MQYRPVGIVFLVSSSLVDLEKQITDGLTDGKLLHGDWKVMPNGSFAQAMCPADWRPVPPPKQQSQESGIVVPKPSIILG